MIQLWIPSQGAVLQIAQKEEGRSEKHPATKLAKEAEASGTKRKATDAAVDPNLNPNADDVTGSVSDTYDCFLDDDFLQQDALKPPFVAEKEPLSALAAEFQSGSPILQEKIKILGEQYGALRRTRGDGNCFYRSFMFSYLEHILETQDKAEVDRILLNIEQCKITLQNLGYIDFTFEDFFSIFIEQLESVLQGSDNSISLEELLRRSQDQSISDYIVMFFRFVTAGEIRKRSEFFEPFVAGLTNSSVEQFCKTSVEPMGEESDHVHIIALSDALGVPIRVVYLDRSSCDAGGPTVNHHDFLPSVNSPPKEGSTEESGNSDLGLPGKPYVTLLYRPGHYDILYPK